jgi:hypothetical protein
MAKHYATSVVRVEELEIGFELLLPSGMDGVPPATSSSTGSSSSMTSALAKHPKSG